VRLIATTGTAGNFGITLFKPLGIYFDYQSGFQYTYDTMMGACSNLPYIYNGAALFHLVISNATSSGVLSANYTFIEA
jgi:hypothetical protein